MRRALILAALLAAPPALADENRDLDLIPSGIIPGAGSAPQAQPAAPAAAQTPTAVEAGRLYVEEALTTTSLRGNLLVPQPPGGVIDWQNRTSLDGSADWRLSDSWRAAFSDRLNLLAENDTPTPSRRVYRNDFREGYLTWEPADQLYLEAGRINLVSGAALGFNPTDFFKTRSAVSLVTIDPSVLREDRLGSVMARSQWIFADGSLGLAVSPKLQGPTPIVTGFTPSLDPGFGQTNGEDRLLLTASGDFGHDISPQLLLLRDGSTTRYGANISRSIGDAFVGYAEWAGGRQASLASRADAFGIRTGTLPAVTAALFPGGASFANDLSVGGSWTSESKITLNLEYHYHQTGFDRADWNRWFALGQASGPFPLSGPDWFVRGFASDQQEPASRQQVFFRADWTDALVRDLELTALAFVDVYDGSTLSQLSASYNLNDSWTVGVLGSASQGARRSEYGSLAQQGSVILQLVHYF